MTTTGVFTFKVVALIGFSRLGGICAPFGYSSPLSVFVPLSDFPDGQEHRRTARRGQAPSRYWLMGMFDRVMFWLCVAIGVMVGGALFFNGIKDLAVYVLGGMVALGLVLRWAFSGGAED